jgi:hypothetical protein
MDLWEIGFEGAVLIDLAKNRCRWLALVNMVMDNWLHNMRISQDASTHFCIKIRNFHYD